MKGVYQEFCNEYGGAMGETYGVPVEEIVEGIKHGVRKVNIDTDLRMASTGAIRKILAENRKEFDPRQYFTAATKAETAPFAGYPCPKCHTGRLLVTARLAPQRRHPGGPTRSPP